MYNFTQAVLNLFLQSYLINNTGGVLVMTHEENDNLVKGIIEQMYSMNEMKMSLRQ